MDRPYFYVKFKAGGSERNRKATCQFQNTMLFLMSIVIAALALVLIAAGVIR